MQRANYLSLCALVALQLMAPAARATTAIERAREKLSARSRAEAAEILVAEIKKEKGAQKLKDLRRELERSAQIFFTNEGQKNFELAESIRYSGQAEYISKYEEALKTEPGHWKILISLALANIAKNKCDKAQEYLVQALLTDPLSEDNKIVLQKILICSQKSPTPEQEAIIKEAKNSFYIKVGEAQLALDNDKSELALTFAREAINIDPQYPMGYYWAWRALKGEENVGLDEAQRYLTLCKSVTSATRRKYYLETHLCSETDAVEEHLKKLESSTQ